MNISFYEKLLGQSTNSNFISHNYQTIHTLKEVGTLQYPF